MGIASVASGMLGGLPIITVIVRSTVNIQNGAKTKWSNLYHAIFLLVFIILARPFLQWVPRAALSAILVYTGITLASPKLFTSSLKVVRSN